MPAENQVDLALSRLASLVGMWHGEGQANFPTITAVQYTEELVFQSNASEPLLHYIQKTWIKSSGPDNGEPLHWESGFMRLLQNGLIEISNAQNNGRVEVLRGEIASGAQHEGKLVLFFENVLFGNDDRMHQARRKFVLESDVLQYVVEMATNKVPELQRHLEANLKRVL
jgi:THAP4-like, heme-binding beta-barrel domain